MKTQIIKSFTIIFSLFLLSLSLMSQNFGMRDITTGRIVTNDNYGEPNLAYLREADIKSKGNYPSFLLAATNPMVGVRVRRNTPCPPKSQQERGKKHSRALLFFLPRRN